MKGKVKVKEDKKLDKYLDLARELKILWNLMVTVIRIVVGAFERSPRPEKQTQRVRDSKKQFKP